jgi:thymidine kinase
MLLQAAFNYRERGMHPLIYTAAIDKRAGEGVVASRIGLKDTARLFSGDTDLYADISERKRVNATDCVLVDEAQFLTSEHVFQLARVVDLLSIPVLCFGLRTDFRGELFPGSERLLALADEIRELKTICHCGRKATMNLRIDAKGEAVRSGASVEIGGNERYVPLCRKHFFERFEGERV